MVAVAFVALLVASALVGDYVVATWRADEAVASSESALCGIVRLAVAAPVPKPSDPVKTPAQETTYRWYLAFLSVNDTYHCAG